MISLCMSKPIKKCGCRSQINKDCITLLNCNMAYIGVTKLGEPGQWPIYWGNSRGHIFYSVLTKLGPHFVHTSGSLLISKFKCQRSRSHLNFNHVLVFITYVLFSLYLNRSQLLPILSLTEACLSLITWTVH